MSNRTSALAGAVAALLLNSGCNGSSPSSPVPSIANISGDYTGTLEDGTAGTLTASAVLAQHGSAAGGSLSLTGAVTLVAAVSFSVSSTNALSGAIVEDKAGNACTLSVTGNYNPGSFQITGSYQAVSGCAGETGTFTLNQQCVDTVTAIERRPMGLAHC